MAENIAISSAVLMLQEIKTESDSSFDEEWELLKKKIETQVLRARMKNVEFVIELYTDDDFKSHFRLKRATFEYILDIISDDLIRKTKGYGTIPPRKQFLIALWKIATMDSYRSICDRFDVGRATGEQAQTIINKFKESSRFPNTIGAIDGTHIKIDAPKENAADYVNRKRYHSIQLQVVCDHRAFITHCYVGHPGSVHDQRIFKQSEVATYLNDDKSFHLIVT
ncbi:putative nuclease HARBI1 [Linepithema humile]|uniref:putative nuclease HARBI1 n=1 Tax=Linepithema humile TaxID=83485 RepID=UPI00351E1260